jgi:hypothetical protein
MLTNYSCRYRTYTEPNYVGCSWAAHLTAIDYRLDISCQVLVTLSPNCIQKGHLIVISQSFDSHLIVTLTPNSAVFWAIKNLKPLIYRWFEVFYRSKRAAGIEPA